MGTYCRHGNYCNDGPFDCDLCYQEITAREQADDLRREVEAAREALEHRALVYERETETTRSAHGRLEDEEAKQRAGARDEALAHEKARLAAERFRLGDQTGAIRLLEEAIALLPSFSSFLVQRASYLAHAGRLQQAVQDLNTALDSEPRLIDDLERSSDPVMQQLLRSMSENLQARKAALVQILGERMNRVEVAIGELQAIGAGAPTSSEGTTIAALWAGVRSRAIGETVSEKVEALEMAETALEHIRLARETWQELGVSTSRALERAASDFTAADEAPPSDIAQPELAQAKAVLERARQLQRDGRRASALEAEKLAARVSECCEVIQTTKDRKRQERLRVVSARIEQRKEEVGAPFAEDDDRLWDELQLAREDCKEAEKQVVEEESRSLPAGVTQFIIFAAVGWVVALLFRVATKPWAFGAIVAFFVLSRILMRASLNQDVRNASRWAAESKQLAQDTSDEWHEIRRNRDRAIEEDPELRRLKEEQNRLGVAPEQ
jgi:tetratricopeptide (TPR) repeat protein